MIEPNDPINEMFSIFSDREIDVPSEVLAFEQSYMNGFLGSILDSMVDGVLIVSLAGQILYLNDQMRTLWHLKRRTYTRREMLTYVQQFVVDPDMFLERIWEITADPLLESQDILYLQDGTVIERQTKPLFVSERLVGRLWLFRDVTDQINIEQALRESESNYRILYDAEQRHVQELALLDKVRTAVSNELNLPSLFKIVVNSISEHLGYNLVSLYLLEGDVLTLQHQVGYDQVVSIIPQYEGVSWRAIQSQKPILLEDVNEAPHFIGAIPNIISEVCVPLFANDEVVGMLNVESVKTKLTQADLNLMVDLSEQIGTAIARVNLHSERRAQEELLRRIFDQAPTGMIITHLDGTIVRVNQAFEKTVGYSEAELQTYRFADITHPEDLDNNLSWLHRLVAKEISEYNFEKRYIRKDGSVVPVFLQVSLLHDPQSEPQYTIAQVIDLSDLRTAETALLQRQKMESIGVLAGGIAHDFNNMLVAMMAQSALALRKLSEQEPAREHIEKVQVAAESAAKLTRQLLAYAGKGQFEIKSVNLNQEIEENIHFFEVAISSKSIEIVKNLAEDLPPIMADSSQIQQILMNLILNGVEATEQQGKQLIINTDKVRLTADYFEREHFVLLPPAPGKFAKVSVQDFGIGMAQETVEKIFDPFFTTKFTGRGLGLAAVLGIVRSHNGGLVVQSQPQIGTRFDIYFPASGHQQANVAQRVVDDKLEKTAEMTITRREVLLIDDDLSVRDTISDVFEMHQIKLHRAANGSDGIAQLKKYKTQIGVVLLDLSMPGLSSYDTFLGLRRIVPDVPIILCSGYSEREISEKFEAVQYNDFIQKPFEISRLIEAVESFLP